MYYILKKKKYHHFDVVVQDQIIKQFVYTSVNIIISAVKF